MFYCKTSSGANTAQELKRNYSNTELTTTMLAEKVGVCLQTILNYKEEIKESCESFRELKIANRDSFVVNIDEIDVVIGIVHSNQKLATEMTTYMISDELDIAIATVSKNKELIKKSCIAYRELKINGKDTFVVDRSEINILRAILAEIIDKPGETEFTKSDMIKETGVSRRVITKHEDQIAQRCKTYRKIKIFGQDTFVVDRSEINILREILADYIHDKQTDTEMTTVAIAAEFETSPMTVLSRQKTIKDSCSTYRELIIGGNHTFVVDSSELDVLRNIFSDILEKPTKTELTTGMIAKHLGIGISTVLSNKEKIADNCKTYRELVIRGRDSFVVSESEIDVLMEIFGGCLNKPTDSELTTSNIASELGISTSSIRRNREKIINSCDTYREVKIHGYDTFVVDRSELNVLKKIFSDVIDKPADSEMPTGKIAKMLGISDLTVSGRRDIISKKCETYRQLFINRKKTFVVDRSELSVLKEIFADYIDKPTESELTTTDMANELGISVPTITKNRNRIQEGCSTYRELKFKGSDTFVVDRSELAVLREIFADYIDKPTESELTTLDMASESGISVPTIRKNRNRIQEGCSTYRELKIRGRDTFVVDRSELNILKSIFADVIDKPADSEMSTVKIAKVLGISDSIVLGRRDIISKKCETYRELFINGKKTFVVDQSELSVLKEIFSDVLTRTNRNLDVRKATGEQVSPKKQKSRPTIKMKTPLQVGTALLNGRFEKDATNIFNPGGMNTPDNRSKHQQVDISGDFSLQEAVETAIYLDIRDLIKVIDSKTTRKYHRDKTNQRANQDSKDTKYQIFSINEAEDIVLQLAEKISRNDSDILLDLYQKAAADPENIEKSRELVNTLKNLKIQYNNDIYYAYLLVFQKNYDKLFSLADILINRDVEKFMLAEYLGHLNMIKSGLVENPEEYRQICEKYNIEPSKDLKKIIRELRLIMLKLSAETKEYLWEITSEAEDLVSFQ